MQRVLWVTAEVPDASLGGGNIRQAYLLAALTARANVDLVVAGGPPSDDISSRLGNVYQLVKPDPAPPPSSKLRQRVRDLGIATFGREPFELLMEQPARENIEAALPDPSAYDVVIAHHAALAPLVRRRSGQERWIIELQNVGSQRSLQQAAVAGHWRHRFMWKRDAQRARRLERWIGAQYDLVISVSTEDAAALVGNVAVVPNGVDLSAFTPTPVPDAPRVVLTASFNYPPNVDGAIWFCNEVLPRVRSHVPETEVELVGREPTAAVIALGSHPGVRCAFNVPSVAPHLAAARVAVVPLRVGTGTRLKALEALAAGRPVAGTSTGLAGLGLEHGRTAMIADDPAELAAALVTLLRSDDAATAIARAGRAHVEGGYGWDQLAERYVDVVLAGPVSDQPSSAAPPGARRPSRSS